VQQVIINDCAIFLKGNLCIMESYSQINILVSPALKIFQRLEAIAAITILNIVLGIQYLKEKIDFKAANIPLYAIRTIKYIFKKYLYLRRKQIKK